LLGRYARVVDHLAVRNVAQGVPLGGGSTLHQYWKTYVKKPRNLKTQNGFIQKVTEIKTKSEIKSKPQPLSQRRNCRRGRNNTKIGLKEIQ